MSKIVVVGGGGHAKVLVGVLKRTSWDILGYSDQADRGVILGIPYLGSDDKLPGILRAQGHCSAVIGVGKIDASPARMRLQTQISALGFDFPAIVAPTAVVGEEVELGFGTVVFDGAVINSGAVTGSACIVNTNSTVEHDCRLGDNVHIASGATLSGGVIVHDNCLLGAGSTVIQNVVICADCLIGAGSTVVKDIEVAGVYAGNPARRLA